MTGPSFHTYAFSDSVSSSHGFCQHGSCGRFSIGVLLRNNALANLSQNAFNVSFDHKSHSRFRNANGWAPERVRLPGWRNYRNARMEIGNTFSQTHAHNFEKKRRVQPIICLAVTAMDRQ